MITAISGEGVTSHEHTSGDKGGLCKQEALRSSHRCSRRGLGSPGARRRVAAPIPALRWLRPLLPGELAWGSTAGSGNQCLPAAFCCGAYAGLGGLSEIFFSSPFSSDWKSFDTQCPFTQGQFLIDTPHRLSSPKYVLSEEFPSSCSFMERSLKSQGDPEPV